jgi:acyl-CoA thioesterase-1
VRILLVLLTFFLLATACAGGAAASQSSPLYLALGDSLAAGVGASDPSQTGYVSLVFNALRTEPTSPYAGENLTLLNLGDPGETTTSMLAGGDQMEQALAEIESRRNDGVDGNEAVVISIDIGANDFIPLVLGDSPCLPNPLAQACQDAAASALATFRSNFADIMRRLRAAAGPEVEIVALGLYNPLSGTGGPFDAVGDAAVELFNRNVATTVAQPDIQARLADVFPLFQGRGPELTHAAELPPDVHPNDSGHYLLALAVVKGLGLPAEAVATPPSGAPPVATLSSTPPTQAPTSTVPALPSTGGDGDDDTPWPLYVGLIVAGIVVATGLLVLARRRR